MTLGATPPYDERSPNSPTKRFLTVFVFVLGLGLAFFAAWARLPYYPLGPGPAREVQPLIV